MKTKVLTSWMMVWLLVAVLLLAGGALNLSQRAYKDLPVSDGISWVYEDGGVYAERVLQGQAGARAEIFEGDRLISISLDPNEGASGELPVADEITRPSQVPMYLEIVGKGNGLTYIVERTLSTGVVEQRRADLTNLGTIERWPPSVFLLAFVGLVWLLVGLFVLFKQGSGAPFVIHFATLCISAFVFHVYRPLGLGEDFDLGVQLLDNLAFAAFVPLFLHFCLRYPVRSEVFDKNRWKTYALYAPAAVLVILDFVLSLTYYVIPSESFLTAFYDFVGRNDLFSKLNSAFLWHFVVGVSVGAGILMWRFLGNRNTLVKQRLKWAMWGTIVAVVPVFVFQVAKRFVFIPDDGVVAAVTILPLALIPFSFGHSVVRYRLMDVDVVVRRALVYAITTIAIAMMIGAVALGLVFAFIGDNLSNTEIALRSVIAVVAMGAIVLLSEPLKNFLQERADRYFYGERYDMRRGLLDFGRTLSASTALDPLLEALSGRLQQVLEVQKVTVFIEDKSAPEDYRIAKSVGLSDQFRMPGDFRNMIRTKSAAKGIVRVDEFTYSGEANENGQKGGVMQELHYFVPCVVRGRMVAVIGLGRAKDGSLLSSEDISILQTVSGYVAVAIDNALLLQEQERRAEEMALLKEFNESIVESVNVGLLAVNDEGIVTRCNTSFEQMFEFERDEVIGENIHELFVEDFAARLESILGKSTWRLTDIRNAYKVRTELRNGEPLILNVAIAPLKTETELQDGAIVLLENVTSRVKLEEGLQQNEKLSSIGLLAAGVAHEVNTPLTGVSSYTQMLMSMIPENDPKHELLEKVRKQTDRASNIVGNLLNFSRSGESGGFEKIDVNKLLEDTLQLLEPQMRQADVAVLRNYADRPPKIMGDAGKLQQVFTNLVLNARDAIVEGDGVITLTTHTVEDDVIIEVSDNGSGISPGNLNKIFDPFFTTKEVGAGTGLGMAVSYGIVQEHSGSITADSEIDKGTTFTLSFPRAKSRDRQIA